MEERTFAKCSKHCCIPDCTSHTKEKFQVSLRCCKGSWWQCLLSFWSGWTQRTIPSQSKNKEHTCDVWPNMSFFLGGGRRHGENWFQNWRWLFNFWAITINPYFVSSASDTVLQSLKQNLTQMHCPFKPAIGAINHTGLILQKTPSEKQCWGIRVQNSLTLFRIQKCLNY
jgi:hypothetical protein